MDSKAHNNLAQYINYYGISKTRLANIAGMSTATLDDIISGGKFPTRLVQAARAMIVLGVSPEDILGDAEVNNILDALEK
ncbi:MAG: helix-turn-helix transcriptional regulator [Selenomonas sp.]|nr:helix-turn-helix transcriptional regulator [Selenomonas sp.]MBO6253004.1 helix-turn-helix transcriptional regulator [Bacteroidaceae bacterium]